MITFTPWRRKLAGYGTAYLPLPWGDMRDASENPLTAATYPSVIPYDTQATGNPLCELQSNTGTKTNIWWIIVTIPYSYVAASNLTLKFDGSYTLGGDGVLVASTLDVEAFPYDSTNGDFSNADICATVAQSLATSFATKSFTLTGTTVTPGIYILIRFTSVVQITSAGGAGTGRNGFNFPRVEYRARP